jgi:hypothetical protein
MTKAEFIAACRHATESAGDIDAQLAIFKGQFAAVTANELEAARCAFEMLARERPATPAAPSTGWWHGIFQWGQSE